MEHNVVDMLIVGAGPAGLMAAKTAAENGLSVCVIEKQQDFSELQRACSAQFILDDGYEGEWLKVTDGKLVFQRNNFEVAYTGDLVPLRSKYYHSPKGHIIRFKRDDGEPFALKFDKRKLLDDLYKECQQLGVVFKMGTLAVDGLDHGSKISLVVIKDGIREVLEGKKLIVAEGVNAHLSTILGLDESRIHLSTAYCVKYMLEGVKGVEPNSWHLYYGRAYHAYAPIIIGPSLYGTQIVEMTITGDARMKPDMIYEKLFMAGPLKDKLADSKLIKKQGCMVKAYSSLKVPYKGNVLAIGDAAAFVEVEVQGALMCGYHAAIGVRDELKGEKGFESYTAWWQAAFEFNSEEYLKVSQGYALVPTYTDDEIDYLFKLIEGQALEGTYSQYKTPQLIWQAILMHDGQIKKEAPEVYDKIQKLHEMSLSSTVGK